MGSFTSNLDLCFGFGFGLSFVVLFGLGFSLFVFVLSFAVDPQTAAAQ